MLEHSKQNNKHRRAVYGSHYLLILRMMKNPNVCGIYVRKYLSSTGINVLLSYGSICALVVVLNVSITTFFLSSLLIPCSIVTAPENTVLQAPQHAQLITMCHPPPRSRACCGALFVDVIQNSSFPPNSVINQTHTHIQLGNGRNNFIRTVFIFCRR